MKTVRCLLNKFSLKTRKVGEQSGEKISIGCKGQAAVTKFHEKQTPAKFDKKQHLEKIHVRII
ncbi:hypothetical protein KHA80_22550 [Anaerobacillus sp. HL2]|nr:hypothetical protein KHA80_22550 [Anaerobacillus sp. HL2]